MSSENAPREALAKMIGDEAIVLSRQPNYTSTEEWLDNPDEIADAVIAHLWEAADDPAVVEAVVLSGMLFPGRASEPEVKQQRALAAGWILRVLTPLIGPRPTEQERDDE